MVFRGTSELILKNGMHFTNESWHNSCDGDGAFGHFHAD